MNLFKKRFAKNTKPKKQNLSKMKPRMKFAANKGYGKIMKGLIIEKDVRMLESV